MTQATHLPTNASRTSVRKPPDSKPPAPKKVPVKGRASSKTTKAKPADDFVSPDDMQALMEGSAEARAKRMAAADMVSTDEAGKRVGVKNRVTINTWISKGRAIGLQGLTRGYRLPTWQFDRPMWDLLPKLAEALGTSEGWAMLSFLETPHGGLDGLTPRQAVERGQTDRVLELAKRALDA